MKNKKFSIITVAIIIFLSLICAVKPVVAVYYNYYSLWRRQGYNGADQSIMCIAEGYALRASSSGNYIREHKITINGLTAKMGDKEVKSKANAILAYIAYAASQEKGLGEYSSPAQLAMWPYFPVWYKNVGKNLGVKSRFNISNWRSTKNNKILNEAEEYYKHLKGDEGVQINLSNSLGEKGDYYFIGPLVLKKNRNDAYIKDGFQIKKSQSDNGIRIITREDYKNNNIKLTTNGNFGTIYYIAVPKSKANNNKENLKKYTYRFTYTTKRIDANINLYRYNYTWQNFIGTKAVIKDTSIEKAVTTDPVEKPDTPEPDVSLQKFIVEAGSNFNSETNRFNDDVNYSFKYSLNRASRNASQNSNTKIYNENIRKNYGSDPSWLNTTEANTRSGLIKGEGPIEINVGDYVIYKVEAYNNVENAEGWYTLEERIDKRGKIVAIYDYHENNVYGGKYSKVSKYSDYVNNLKKLNNNENGEKLFYLKESSSKYNYYIWSAKLDKLKKNSFWIVVKYDNKFNGIISNRAKVSSYCSSNTYRTVDYDYIRIKEETANVSLQKYIVKVNGQDLSNSNLSDASNKSSEDWKNRENRYSYIGAIEQISENNRVIPNTKEEQNTKIGNVVNIEAGDSVTYAIKVYNNGEETRKVTIADILPKYATGYWNQKNQFIPIDINNEQIPQGDPENDPEAQNVTTDETGEDFSINDLGEVINSDDLINRNEDEDFNNNQNSDEDAQENFIEDAEEQESEYNIESKEIEYDLGEIKKHESKTIYITVKFDYFTKEVLKNKAKIKTVKNMDDKVVKNVTEYRTVDDDYAQMKEYAVSLKKYVSAINGISLNNNTRDPNDKYATAANREANPEDQNPAYTKTTDWDNNTNTFNINKYNYPVTVSHGDFVTYTIKVKNDSKDTKVKITEIEDVLPDGIDLYKLDGYSNNLSEYSNIPANKKIHISNIRYVKLLDVNEEYSINVTVRVSESNMSNKLLRNTAEITKMQNKNNIVVQDTTGYNNFDADYIQLNYKNDEAIISGKVWNDTARNKTSNDYNGLYDTEDENVIKGIKVYLCRSKGAGRTVTIASKYTDQNGYYSFADKDINWFYTSETTKEYNEVINNSDERYIKSGKILNTNRWIYASSGLTYYYAYYVVFEYDGITYTTTKFGNINDANKYTLNSNAKEDNTNGKSGLTTRKDFNDKFKTINNSGAHGIEGDISINYERYIGKTLSGNNIIPQSRHIYDERYMNMQASTNEILLGQGYSENKEIFLDQIKNINVGLRGRDTFDLRLKSSVEKINVTINGIQQEYAGSGQDFATIRLADITRSNDIIVRDAANVAGESTLNTSEYEQSVRNSDTPYIDEITVTYRIDIENESNSKGYATKLIDYYDNNWLRRNDEGSKNEIRSVIIDGMNQNNQSQLITYTLTNEALNKLVSDGEINVFHMAEIYEYTTYSNNNESTRGLLDLDSAPGTVNIEKVILTDDYNALDNGEMRKINKTSGDTTVQYYFNGTKNKIMYEDDTRPKVAKLRATNNNIRTLTGNVFEDFAEVNSVTKIKSGNGMYIDNKDKPVYGANVTLEIYKGDTEEVVKTYDEETKTDGSYTINGFIPGRAKLTFKYGDTEKTILIGDVNTKSYNGEDFEATNNTALDLSSEDFWYAKNEANNEHAISVAEENDTRRDEVSKNVIASENLVVELNKARSGQTENVNIDEIKNKTSMNASSKKFLLTVEKTRYDNGFKMNNLFEDYTVHGMNFGISEVPVSTIDLKSSVKALEIKDAAGDNTIAKAVRGSDGKWKIEAGNILAPTEESGKSMLYVSVEDEKLQGAKLKITYEITSDQKIEKDFKGNTEIPTKAVISGLVDYVDNNLSYNADSKAEGNTYNNSQYWQTTTYEATQAAFKDAIVSRGETTEINGKYGYVDKEGKLYTTILKASDSNPLITNPNDGKASCDLVLEKVLSAHDNTLSDIIASTVDSYDYKNRVEITGVNYEYTRVGDLVNADRIQREDRNIVIPGDFNVHNTAESGEASITPPTGDSTEYNNMVYYIIAISSLAVLAVGTVLIKKYALKKD